MTQEEVEEAKARISESMPLPPVGQITDGWLHL